MNKPFQLPVEGGRHGRFTTPARLLLATTAALWMGAAQGTVSPPELLSKQSGTRSTPDHGRRLTLAGPMARSGMTAE